MKKIIAFTGHTNIEKCCGKIIPDGGEVYDKQSYDVVYNDIQIFMELLCKKKDMKLSDFIFVSGMARGVDEVAAMFAINNNLELILSIPSSIWWHKNRPPSKGIRAQALWYDFILAYPNIKEIREVKKGAFYFVNFARNVDMVGLADVVVSYKKYDSSGTDHCVAEAKKVNKYLGNIPDLIKKEN